ncbi:MAG TPA: hypothetical protein VEJ16_18730 [Alphaproteobacteria bacterium]|nr:hypothetical protein [Alphaproteobacteria bacterium]
MRVENTSMLERLFAGGAIREMPRRSRWQWRRRWRRTAKFIFADLGNVVLFLGTGRAGRGGVRD